ncbi:MAG: RNA polymerase sigma factor [Polyangiales bacterium]
MQSALSLSIPARAPEWPVAPSRFRPSVVEAASATPTRDAASLAMERYAGGDERAFEEVYAQLAPRLHRLCVCLIGRGDADDLMQEVFMKMHRARGSFAVGGSVVAWSFAIARTSSVDRARRRRRRPEDTTEPERIESRAEAEASCPESTASRKVLAALLEARLASLTESVRAAYILVKVDGMSCAEAAEVLGTTSTAVKQRVHRATEELRAALARAGW